ncbi:hypothetical protein EK21DRAFT_108432 [Setomelanomma holmii]|uniref:Uncharacterized protein n=1 Tax=Setomelanomma holmii TaxID=210430 RepID=A0A9P4HHA5_9PLEO|nr:hypothetical protein EK21DRAFT_108432 [Setomelanomma holmii]
MTENEQIHRHHQPLYSHLNYAYGVRLTEFNSNHDELRAGIPSARPLQEIQIGTSYNVLNGFLPDLHFEQDKSPAEVPTSPSTTSLSLRSYQHDPALKEAFSYSNLTVDLLRCPDGPEPCQQNHRDRIKLLAAGDSRCRRLLVVRRRWHYAQQRDWAIEMDALVRASKHGLHPWLPLRDLFKKFEDALKASQCGPTNMRNGIRNALKTHGGRRLRNFVMERLDIVEAELADLMHYNPMNINAVRSVVNRAVDEDCDKRGALLLAAITNFSGDKMSSKWSWTDSPPIWQESRKKPAN